MAATEAAEQQQQQALQLHYNLLPVPQNCCWESTPGAGVPPPPRLSLSAILPLSAAGSYQNQPQQQQNPKREKGRVTINNDTDRTMLPRAVANSARPADDESTGLARRFLALSRVRRSLIIDVATVLIFVPLSISTSVALMRLFVRRVGQDQLEWHHYMLVAALASLVLVPICRLAYSGHRYRRRIRRMRLARLEQQRDLSDYTTKSRRIEAAGAARAQEYHQFACLVAKQQNINLSRRGDLSMGGGGGAVLNRSAANISGISCHRPDISMAAYNC